MLFKPPALSLIAVVLGASGEIRALTQPANVGLQKQTSTSTRTPMILQWTSITLLHTVARRYAMQLQGLRLHLHATQWATGLILSSSAFLTSPLLISTSYLCFNPEVFLCLSHSLSFEKNVWHVCVCVLTFIMGSGWLITQYGERQNGPLIPRAEPKWLLWYNLTPSEWLCSPVYECVWVCAWDRSDNVAKEGKAEWLSVFCELLCATPQPNIKLH